MISLNAIGFEGALFKNILETNGVKIEDLTVNFSTNYHYTFNEKAHSNNDTLEETITHGPSSTGEAVTGKTSNNLEHDSIAPPNHPCRIETKLVFSDSSVKKYNSFTLERKLFFVIGNNENAVFQFAEYSRYPMEICCKDKLPYLKVTDKWKQAEKTTRVPSPKNDATLNLVSPRVQKRTVLNYKNYFLCLHTLELDSNIELEQQHYYFSSDTIASVQLITLYAYKKKVDSFISRQHAFLIKCNRNK